MNSENIFSFLKVGTVCYITQMWDGKHFSLSKISPKQHNEGRKTWTSRHPAWGLLCLNTEDQPRRSITSHQTGSLFPRSNRAQLSYLLFPHWCAVCCHSWELLKCVLVLFTQLLLLLLLLRRALCCCPWLCRGFLLVLLFVLGLRIWSRLCRHGWLF